MIRIAVCDDDRNVVESIQRYLEEKDRQLQEERLDISLYSSGEDFLRDIEAGAVFHIVFMDIQMNALNGVEVGKILREQPDKDSTIIIYISSYNSYAEALLDIGNIRFLKKPITRDQLERMFNRVFSQALKYKEILNQHLSFGFNVHKESHSIKMCEIVYMKSNGKFLELYVWDSAKKAICFEDRFYSSISATLEQLPKEQFTQCGRWHIVNLDCVQRLAAEFLTLTDERNTQIPVGNTFRESVKEAYFRRKKG